MAEKPIMQHVKETLEKLDITTATMYRKDREQLEILRIDHMHRTRKFINTQDFLHLVIEEKTKRR